MKIFRQLGTLLSGSALGQILGFAFVLALTHVYPPQLLGEYQAALNFAMILATIYSLKLEIPLPTLPADTVQKHVKAVARLVILMVLASLLLANLLLLALGEPVGVSWETVHLTIAIGLLIALNNLWRFYLIERQSFGVLSWVVFVQTGGRGFLQYLAQFSQAFGLFLGDIVARTITLMLACRASGLSLPHPRSFMSPERDRDGDLRSVMSTHWRYPVWVVPSTMLNNSMDWFLVPVVAAKYGLVEAGVVAVAYRILVAPNSVLGSVFSDVFFARFGDLVRSENARRLPLEFLLASGGLLVVSIGAFGFIWFAAPYLELVVGELYDDASLYLLALLPWFAVQLVVSPVSRVIFVFDMQVYKFLFDVGVFTVLIGCVFLLNNVNMRDFLWIVSTSMAGLYLCYYVILWAIVIFGTRRAVRKPE